MAMNKSTFTRINSQTISKRRAMVER